MSPQKDVDEHLTTSDVFNPGQFPRYTYRSRRVEEAAVEKWWRDRGKILVVHGPSKTGKTVLMQKLLDEFKPIWIDGHGLDSATVMWARIADQLGLFTNVTRGNGEADGHTTNLELTAGFSGTGIGTNPTHSTTVENSLTFAVDRPVELVVRETLQLTERPLVIDDIHFVSAEAQNQIIQALKPLIFGNTKVPGRRVIFVSIGNRVINVLTNLDDMRDRMLPLPLQYWDENDLQQIAKDGFVQLRLIDADGSLSSKLASQSFGSPHLMQQLCRELCSGEPNNCFEAARELEELSPPASWEAFFKAQLLDDVGRWVTKLAKGPDPRGSKRELTPTKSGNMVDGYQLLLLVMASTGPKLELTKDEIRTALLDVSDKEPPFSSVPTKTLTNLSLIAATKLLDKLPSLTELRARIEAGFDPYAEAELQPVLEYRDTGATSALTITDPFFAFYLAWGLHDTLDAINAAANMPAKSSTSDADTDAQIEEDEWGDLV